MGIGGDKGHDGLVLMVTRQMARDLGDSIGVGQVWGLPPDGCWEGCGVWHRGGLP